MTLERTKSRQKFSVDGVQVVVNYLSCRYKMNWEEVDDGYLIKKYIRTPNNLESEQRIVGKVFAIDDTTLQVVFYVRFTKLLLDKGFPALHPEDDLVTECNMTDLACLAVDLSYVAGNRPVHYCNETQTITLLRNEEEVW